MQQTIAPRRIVRTPGGPRPVEWVDACNADPHVLEAFARAEGNIAVAQRLQTAFDQRGLEDKEWECFVLERAFLDQLNKLGERHSILIEEGGGEFFGRLDREATDRIFQILKGQVPRREFNRTNQRLLDLQEAGRIGENARRERRPESDTESESD